MQPRLIRIELDSAGPSIKGKLIADEGSPHPFSGWISLLAELQALLENGPGPVAGNEAERRR
jgi:hypothetical protein